MTPPTIAPVLFLDEVEVCALDADVLFGDEVLIRLDETMDDRLLLLVTKVTDVEPVEFVVASRSCTRASSRFSPFFLV